MCACVCAMCAVCVCWARGESESESESESEREESVLVSFSLLFFLFFLSLFPLTSLSVSSRQLHPILNLLRQIGIPPSLTQSHHFNTITRPLALHYTALHRTLILSCTSLDSTHLLVTSLLPHFDISIHSFILSPAPPTAQKHLFFIHSLKQQ